jgi:hypothetical protein
MNVLSNGQVSRANYLNNLKANTTREGYIFTPIKESKAIARITDATGVVVAAGLLYALYIVACTF